MKAYLQELQQELLGSVTDSPDALDYFATDASVFSVTPAGAVYPQTGQDVVHVVKYVAERAAAGKKISLTARGQGSDLGGGPLGDGLIVVFPAHLNRLLGFDKKSVTVQPGMNYGTLQRILNSHSRFLPPYPSSLDVSTIGGAVANDAGGEKSVKYGTTRDFIERLSVVLSDGSVIETKRLSARELSRKKGLSTFEGEIYRKLDALIDDNADLIRKATPDVTKNAAGYALGKVKRSDGSFDLSQLIAGSQGTLGLVTEVTLKTAPIVPKTSLAIGFFDNLAAVGEAIIKLKRLRPSALEMVDHNLITHVRAQRPGMLDGLVPQTNLEIILFVEFDEISQLRQTVKIRQAQRIIKQLGVDSRIATKPRDQQQFWRIRRSAAAVMWMSHGHEQAVPIIEDAVVPLDKIPDFLTGTAKLLKRRNLAMAVWGHAGDGNFHLQPLVDLAKKKHREELLGLADDFYDLVIKLGGSTTGEHNDGLIRTSYLSKQYGERLTELFFETKQLFDPHGIFNPGKKVPVGATDNKTKSLAMRRDYNQHRSYDHLPRN